MEGPWPQSESFTTIEDVVAGMALPPTTFIKHGREMLAGADIDGAKTPGFMASHTECVRAGLVRPYSLVLLSDTLVLGKVTPGCMGSSMRAKAFKLKSTSLATGTNTEGNLVPLQLQLLSDPWCVSGVAAGQPVPAAPSAAREITLWCSSHAQAEGLVGAHEAARAALRSESRSRAAAQRTPHARTPSGRVPHPSQPVQAARASIASTLPPPPPPPHTAPPTHAPEDIAAAPLEGEATGLALPPSDPDTMGRAGSVASGRSIASISVGSREEGGGAQPSRASMLARPSGFRPLIPGAEGGVAAVSAVDMQVDDLPPLPPFDPAFDNPASRGAADVDGSALTSAAQEGEGGDHETEVAETGDGSATAAEDPTAEFARHRYNVYCEIYDTERAYMKALQVLIKSFKRPLQRKVDEGAPVLPEPDIPKVFSNIEHVLQVNGALLSSLVHGLHRMGVVPRSAVDIAGAGGALGVPPLPVTDASPPKPSSARPPTHPAPAHGRPPALSSGTANTPVRLSSVFAHAFKSVAPFFRLYAEYCRNYWAARDLVEHYKANSEQFRGLLIAAGHGDLSALLIKPVQRICKYPLLFKDLLKHMPDGHPSREDLEGTLATIQRVASDVDAQFNRQESLTQMVKVHTLLGGGMDHLIVPGRTLTADWRRVLVGDPTEDRSKKRTGSAAVKAAKRRRLWLFNNLLVIGKHISGSESQQDETAPGGPRYVAVHEIALTREVTLRPGWGMEPLEPSDPTTTESTPSASPQEDAKDETPASDAASRPPSLIVPPAPGVGTKARSSTTGTLKRNPGAGAGVDGRDMFHFDVVYSEASGSSGGQAASFTSGTRSIVFLRLWFESAPERDSTWKALHENLLASSKLAEDLRWRKSKHSGRRAWTTKTGGGTLGGSKGDKVGGLSGATAGLSALAGRHTLGGTRGMSLGGATSRYRSKSVAQRAASKQPPTSPVAEASTEDQQ